MIKGKEIIRILGRHRIFNICGIEYEELYKFTSIKNIDDLLSYAINIDDIFIDNGFRVSLNRRTVCLHNRLVPGYINRFEVLDRYNELNNKFDYTHKELVDYNKTDSYVLLNKDIIIEGCKRSIINTIVLYTPPDYIKGGYYVG